MAFDYPVYLDLKGIPVLVVGAGSVAARKAEGLLEAGARVRIVAPQVGTRIAALAAAAAANRSVEPTAGAEPLSNPQLTVVVKRYEPADLDGIHLVITATDDTAVNAAVAGDARARRVPVNSADDPANCSFILPAITRRGRIMAAVSSGGASPALAQHVRDRIANEVLTECVVAAADVLATERDAIHAAGGSTEGLDWSRRLAELLASRSEADTTS